MTNVAAFLVENASGLFGAATSLLAGLVDGITEALPDLLTKGTEILTNIITGISSSFRAWPPQKRRRAAQPIPA
ncbi:MAG: hypothetical protein Q4G52_09015 [Clostridia bacterium]|nr:hypothetical protein [Clostridia bacterium]